VAAALHARSPRKDFPFVPINCAAIPRISSRASCSGTYAAPSPGAVQTKKGALRGGATAVPSPRRGGELPSRCRASCSASFRAVVPPVGGTTTSPSTSEIVCASKRTAPRRWSRGGSGTTLLLPPQRHPGDRTPLRDRREDILRWPPFPREILGKARQADGADRRRGDAALLAYDFPKTCGNLRTSSSGRRS